MSGCDLALGPLGQVAVGDGPFVARKQLRPCTLPGSDRRGIADGWRADDLAQLQRRERRLDDVLRLHDIRSGRDVAILYPVEISPHQPWTQHLDSNAPAPNLGVQ